MFFQDKYFYNFIYFTLLIIPLMMIFDTGLSDLILSITVIYGLIFIYSQKKINEIKKIIIDNKVILFLFLLTLGFILSSIINSYKVFKIENLLKSIFFIRFPIFISLIIFTKYNFSIKYKYIILSFFISFLLLVISLIIQKIDCSTINFFCYNEYRLSGILRDELKAGSVITKLSIPLIYYCIISNNNYFFNSKYIKSLIIFCIFVFVFQILMITGERVAMIVFLLCTILILYFLYKKYFFKILLIVFIATITISYLNLGNRIFYLDPDFILNKSNFNYFFNNIFYRNFLDFNIYLDLYKVSFSMFLDNSLTGVGFKNFRIFCPSYLEISRTTFCSTHPHSIYFEILSENGIFIMIIFFLFLYYNIKNLIYYIRHKSHISTSFLITIIIFLMPVVSTFSFTGNINALVVTYFLSLSFLFNDKKI